MSYAVYNMKTGARVSFGPTTGAYGGTYGYPVFTGPEFHHVLKWIKSKGFHIYANPQYGGVNFNAHSLKSWHYMKDGNGLGLGADIGTYGDVNERSRIINELIPTLNRIGMGYHYAQYGDVPNHWNHIHVDVSNWGRRGGAAPNYGFYTTYKKLNVYTALPLSSTTIKPKSVTTRPGDTGTKVKIVQRIAKTVVDGSNGPATVRAVKALQKRLGLTQDGVFGPKTARAYFASVGTRRQGSTGYTVQMIQYIAGIKIDGSYGPATTNAVKSMQRWAGLTADGVFGAGCRSKLLI